MSWQRCHMVPLKVGVCSCCAPSAVTHLIDGVHMVLLGLLCCPLGVTSHKAYTEQYTVTPERVHSAYMSMALSSHL